MSHISFIRGSGDVAILFASFETYRGHPLDLGRVLLTKPFVLYALAAALAFHLIVPNPSASHLGAVTGLFLTFVSFAAHGFLWWLQVAAIGVATRRWDYTPAIPSILLQVLPAVALITIGHLQIGPHVHPVDGMFHMPLFFYSWFILVAVVFEAVAALFVLPRGLERLQAQDR